MRPIKTFIFFVVLALGFQASARADVCTDPALADVRYQALRVQLQTGAEPEDIAVFMRQVRAIAILSWRHKGRDAVARDGLVVNAVASCYGGRDCGLGSDGDLSQRLYDDLGSGFPNNVFGRELPQRPPASALAFARDAFGCASAAPSAPAASQTTASLSPSEQQMLQVVRAYQAQRFDEAYRLAVPLCEVNLAAACHLAGDIKKREDSPEAFVLARAHFRAACAEDMALACYEYGLLMAMGRGGPEDLVGARAAFQQGCQGGHAGACGGFAEYLYAGKGGPVDMVEAARVGTIACDGDDPVGCFFLGLIAEREERLEDVLPYHERACRLGMPQGCVIAEYYYGARAQADGDHTEAYLHFASGCEREGADYSAVLCLGAAEVASRPDVDIADDVIEGHIQRACELGQADACAMLAPSSGDR